MNRLKEPWPQSAQFMIVILFFCSAGVRVWFSVNPVFSNPIPIQRIAGGLKNQADVLAGAWVSQHAAVPGNPLKTLYSGGRNGRFTVIYEDSSGGRFQMLIQVEPGGAAFRWAMWPYRKSYS